MNNKMLLSFVALLLTLVFPSYAGLIEIGPGENFGAESLSTGDELLMTGGWGESVSMGGSSIASIYATDAGKEIYSILAGTSSTLNIYGGTIREIETQNSNTTTIKGGDIGTLICSQDVHEDGPGGAVIPMTTLYVLDGWSYNDTSMILTGQWQNSTAFEIQLEDKYGISTYDNLNIIPEPCSLVLLGLASLALRRRK